MITGTQLRPPGAVRAPVTLTFRPDIQGLRAVAVIAVILDHLIGWPRGGFIGVDVFFVISGFLITGIMLGEQSLSGAISWRGFYRRRFKRIIPAATLVLVATVAASYLVYRVARFESIASDSVYSFFFMANWHFADVGTDYFRADGPVSPLQHFWSLSLEEQFYLAWPALLIAAFAIAAAKASATDTRRRTVILTAGIAVVAVASFGWAMWETAGNPTWAYFSTFSRAWELAAGALLAVTATTMARIPAAVRPLLTYLGLLIIAVGLFVISAGSAFPGPWAALPVVGAGLVIAAGIGGPPRMLWPLTNSASSYLGKISYSLYLWHFPVIVLLAAIMAAGTATYIATAVVVMLVLSILSFHFVEDPMRRSSWFEPKQRPVGGNDPWRGARTRRVRTFGLLGGGVTVALVAVLIAVQVEPVDPEVIGGQIAAAAPAAAAAQPSISAISAAPAATTAQSNLSTEINAALAASQWPELTPSLDTLGPDDKAAEWVTDGCLGAEQGAIADPQANAEHCLYGDPAAPKTAVLLGDSVAISYLPGIRAALEPAGWKIRVLTLEQCPFAQIEVLKGDGSAHPDCDNFRKWTLDQVTAIHPELVLISTATSTVGRLVGQPPDGAALELWKPGLAASLTALTGHAGKVVVLAAPPNTGNLLKCATQLSVPQDCEGAPTERYDALVRTERAVVAAQGQGFEYVAVTPWFCSSAGRCPSFIGVNPVMVDGGHLTAAYSKQLGPVLAVSLGIDGA
ncbi:MAG: acyltransferase family protein [Nakamurella sp.]